MGTTQYPIMTICGSMRFYDQILETAQYWTGEGWIVLMPFAKKGEGSNDIRMLDDMHLTKISMSELVLVVSDRSGYYGESTRREIDYAKDHDITIEYVCL